MLEKPKELQKVPRFHQTMDPSVAAVKLQDDFAVQAWH